MRHCARFLLGLLTLLVLMGTTQQAAASHFRYGTIAWKVVDPVNAPLTVEFTVQTAWRANSVDGSSLNFGDGFTNMVVPTSALVMGTLALGKIPYTRWLRFMFPLLIKLFGMAIIVLLLAVRFGDAWGFTNVG